MRLLLALLLTAPLPASASGRNARAQVRAGGLGGTGVSPVNLSVAPASLLGSPGPALTAPPLGAAHAAPVAAPILAAPAAPSPLAAPAPAAAQQGAPRLIDTLAAPFAEPAPSAGGAQSAADAEKDFLARAQLGGGAGLPAATLAAPASRPAPSGLLGPGATLAPAGGKAQVLPFAGVDHSGEVMKAALARLQDLPPGESLRLNFAPSPGSLKALSELPYEVFLYRSRADGTWRMARGDRHGVSGEWGDYDLAIHNHPEARLGAYSIQTDYPSPQDLETSRGKAARFMVVSRSGVAEWDPALPEGIAGRLESTWLGRFVMRVAFPALYPGHLLRHGVLVTMTPWGRFDQGALDAGAGPAAALATRPAGAGARALALLRSWTPAGRAVARELGARALRAQAEAARAQGADAVLAAFEEGGLAGTAPELHAHLERAGEDAMRAALADMDFEADFLYGGITGTHLYTTAAMPGVILKVYKRPLDLLRLPSSASSGYALAKARLGGLFAETAIIRDVTVRVEGKRRRWHRVLVQQRARTKDVKDWGRRAQATLEAMERRGVRDTDTGPRQGIYEADLARNLGEAPDGSLVHFDADWFKRVKGAVEPARRVPDPEPLRSRARQAQRLALAALWDAPR